MLRKATIAIANELKKAGLKYDTIERDEVSTVTCSVGGKTLNYTIHFISTDDDNDVALRVFDLVKYPEEKRNAILEFVNQVNREYRYVKFVMRDDDHTVQIECDFPQRTVDVGPIAVEYVIRIMRILDNCGADLMRTLWA